MMQEAKTQTAGLISTGSSNEPRVLIIEDDAMISNLTSTKFKSSGFIPMTASDGLQAFSLAKKFAPDVIILDLTLPGRSGFLILEDLKRDEIMKTIPVVVFSNMNEQSEITKALKLGAVKYYVKALTDLTFIVKEVQEMLETAK